MFLQFDIAVITGAVYPTLLFQKIQAVDLESTKSSFVISELSTSVDMSSKEGLDNVSMYPTYCIAAIFAGLNFRSNQYIHVYVLQ